MRHPDCKCFSSDGIVVRCRPCKEADLYASTPPRPALEGDELAQCKEDRQVAWGAIRKLLDEHTSLSAQLVDQKAEAYKFAHEAYTEIKSLETQLAEARKAQLSDNDLYYLRSILRNLGELQSVAHMSTIQPSLGGEALADNIDWLDCFIDANERRALAADKENG
jgi:hypothetical protein